MSKNKNKAAREKIIIEKFRKLQNLNTIVTILFAFFLPFIAITFYKVTAHPSPAVIIGFFLFFAYKVLLFHDNPLKFLLL